MQHVDTEKEQAEAAVLLYRLHASRIFAFIYRQVASQQDAEDILLEVFLAAHKAHLVGLAMEQQIAWLQQVARRKVIDLYRRRQPAIVVPLEHAVTISDSTLTPEQQSIQREAYERLYQALGQLSPLEQQVIHLRYGNGLRFAQIAEILDKPEGSLRGLLSRTLRRLRTNYPEEERR